MITLLAALLPCLVQSAPPKDDAPIRNVRIENAAAEDGRPVLRVSGESSYPNETHLVLFLYYGRSETGRHLTHRKIKVQESKFSYDFAFYRNGVNLPGKYLVDIRFDLLQPESVPRWFEETGKKMTEFHRIFDQTLGTEKEIEEGRARVLASLVGELERLDAVAGEVKAGFDEQLQKPDPPSWKNREKTWETEIVEIQKRCYDRPEYKALELLYIANDEIPEKIAGALHGLIHLSTSALRNPESAPNASEQLAQIRDFVESVTRGHLVRLGARQGTLDALKVDLEKLAAQVAHALDVHRMLTEGKMDPEQARTTVENYQRDYRKLAFDIHKSTPENHRDRLRTLTDPGNEICDYLAKVETDPTLPSAPLSALLTTFQKSYAEFLTALAPPKNPPREK